MDIRALREHHNAEQEIKELSERISALEKDIKKAEKDMSFLAFDEQIKKYGLCEIHRRSFVKNFYAEQT